MTDCSFDFLLLLTRLVIDDSALASIQLEFQRAIIIVEEREREKKRKFDESERCLSQRSILYLHMIVSVIIDFSQ